jgi:predicted negative regulator of RcsB-dependent stress response
MAFEEYDDFEQEKLVKDWIKNNWLTIATGLILGLGGVFGLNYWKAQKQQQRFEIANQYQSFSEVFNLSEFDEAKKLLTELESKSGANFYTYEGHLLLAKEFAGKGELEDAASELKKVIDAKPDQLMTDVVKLRLARVYNGMEKYDDALSQAKSIATESLLSIAQEIQGDAHLAKGNSKEAISAYESAVDKGDGYSGKRNIEIKIENA